MQYFYYYFCCLSKQRKSYSLKLKNATSQLDRELDLKKFISRQKLHTQALLSLLSGKQTFYFAKMSRSIVKEINYEQSDRGSDEGSSSGDSGSQALRSKNELIVDHIARQLLQSTDKVDQRILNLNRHYLKPMRDEK